MNEVSELETFIKEFKGVLVEVLDKVRDQSKVHKSPVAQAHLNAKWEIIDLMLITLSRKETDMQKLKSDLIKQVISLDDLDPIKKHSELEERIKEAVDSLHPGSALPGTAIKEDIEWGHFSAKVSQMRKDGKISQDITAKVRGEKFYLVRLPKGQTVKARNKKD